MPKHELPPLPYAFDALEPHIDAQTMQIHHDKHHATYVTKLNEALDKASPTCRTRALEDLLRGINEVPESIRTAVKQPRRRPPNHTLFWEVMGPNGGGDALRRRSPTPSTSDFGGFAGVQGEADQRGHQPVRLRLGLAGGRRRQARRHRPAQPGQPADGRQDPAPGRRRLGARLLPEVPEPAPGLPRRLVEHHQLAGRRRPLPARPAAEPPICPLGLSRPPSRAPELPWALSGGFPACARLQDSVIERLAPMSQTAQTS